jgi:hypothetical protein
MTDAIVPSARPSFDGRMDTMTQTIRIHGLSADGCLVVGEDHSAIGHRICRSIWLAKDGSRWKRTRSTHDSTWGSP